MGDSFDFLEDESTTAAHIKAVMTHGLAFQHKLDHLPNGNQAALWQNGFSKAATALGVGKLYRSIKRAGPIAKPDPATPTFKPRSFTKLSQQEKVKPEPDEKYGECTSEASLDGRTSQSQN